MTSAPRSASIWVPKGPAPNWETARMRRPSSGGRLISIREPALAQGSVALLRHKDLPGVGAHHLVPLVEALGRHRDDPPVALARLPELQHAGARIEGVADEGGLLVLERVHLEVGDGAAREVS